MLLAVLPLMTLPLLSAQLFVAVIGGALAKVLSQKRRGNAVKHFQRAAL
jgi:hypothetical protein